MREYFEWLVRYCICFVKYHATAFRMQQELLIDTGRDVEKNKITEDPNMTYYGVFTWFKHWLLKYSQTALSPSFSPPISGTKYYGVKPHKIKAVTFWKEELVIFWFMIGTSSFLRMTTKHKIQKVKREFLKSLNGILKKKKTRLKHQNKSYVHFLIGLSYFFF